MPKLTHFLLNGRDMPIFTHFLLISNDLPPDVKGCDEMRKFTAIVMVIDLWNRAKVLVHGECLTLCLCVIHIYLYKY